MNAAGLCVRLAFGIALLSACAPATPARERESVAGSVESARASQQDRTLVMVIRGEPVSLASKPVQASGLSVRPATRLFNAELDIADATDSPRPYLVEALPELNTDTWRVFPDGRMETRYRLRANLIWHDGTPLSVEDFVFAWQVYQRPEFGQSGSTPVSLMEEVVAADARTVIVRWKRPFPDAAFLRETFQPLPSHLLAIEFQQRDPDGFGNLPYWSTEYVGLGPYRLVRWEPGSHIEGAAFDGHVLGRPKIDRVVVRFLPDENVVLSNVLSEQVHFTAFQTLRYEHAQVLKREWGGTPKGVIIQVPAQLRFIHVQVRPDIVTPRALLDVRTRRALAHAIDRQALDEGLYNGEGIVTETFLPKTVPYWAEIDRAIAKYPYDQRQTDQMMDEMGYRKGSDGVFVGIDGERFLLDFWGDAGTGFEKELAAVAEGWQRIGIESQLTTVPVAQFRNGQYRNSFRGVYSSAGPASSEREMRMMTSANIATSGNGWTGSNRGGWSNAEYDRLWESFSTTLEREDRIRLVISMEKLIAEQLPMIMQFHNPSVVTHHLAVRGPDPRAPHDLVLWNIHEWEMR